MKRRDFLKLLPLIPLYKVVWPQTMAHHQQQHAHNQPNILVLVFDTLSARHVSLYGYGRETTPNLARLAEKATVFHNHRSTANFTSPSTASILTGTHPWTHRAFHLYGIVPDELKTHNIFNQLPATYHRVAYTHNAPVQFFLHQFRSGIETLTLTGELCLSGSHLAETIFANDYQAAFLGERQSLLMRHTRTSSLFGSTIKRGQRFIDREYNLQAYSQQFPRGIPDAHGRPFVLEDAVDWIAQQVASWPRPYFGYFHLFPPHEPYSARKDFIDIFKDGWKPPVKPIKIVDSDKSQIYLDQKRQEYDEYLAYTDAELGRLLDSLEQSGEFDNTYIVITSDHGQLFERGVHGHITNTLYEPLLHVPLLIHAPKQTERKDVFDITSSVDLLPTFLQWAGQSIPEWAEGRPLPIVTDSPPRTESDAIFSVEAKSNPKATPLQKATVSMTQDGFKLIYYQNQNGVEAGYELYYLPDDPEELIDIADTDASIVAVLKEKLHDQLSRVNQPYL